MAAVKQLELSATGKFLAKPPTGHNSRDKEFKYRGTLFRPSSAHVERLEKTSHSDSLDQPNLQSGNTENAVSLEVKLQTLTETVKQTKPRRIQSAKARLQRHPEQSVPSSSRPTSATGTSFKSDSNKLKDKRPSVVNINATVDVPDKEEEEFLLRVHKEYQKRCNEYNNNQNQRMRPSSAKSTVGCPISSAESETKDKSGDAPNSAIKPSVYGLKLGRQVFGNDSQVHEAWINTERDYPFKLKEGTDNIPKTDSKEVDKRLLPLTLQPLQSWVQHGTPSDVTGLDAKDCIVLLGRNYCAEELPEVPSPLQHTQDLPYTCVVVTPRKETQKKYHHPYFEQEQESLEWKCSHTKAFDPKLHGDISYLLNSPHRRDPNEIRLEIAELENLMQGIGSLTSDCSFVKFQAEIRCARALARRLIFPSASQSTEEPADSFGLLKFYKEHDKAMEIIRERREQCLKELALLESGSCPDDVP